MAAGDHIKAKRAGGLYYHHGIDMGDGSVIHFAGEPLRRQSAEVCRTSLEDFLHGGEALAVLYPDGTAVLPPEETIKRAESQLGRDGYSVFWNNCEHLAVYCKTGAPCSKQVRKYLKTAAVLVAAGSITLAARLVEKRIRRRQA